MKLSKKMAISALSVGLIVSSASAMHKLSKEELKQLEQAAITKYEQERKSKEAWAIWEEAYKNGEIIQENLSLVCETAVFAGTIKLLGAIANQFPNDTTLGILMKAGQLASVLGYYADFNDYKHASQGLLFVCSGALACCAYNAITTDSVITI